MVIGFLKPILHPDKSKKVVSLWTSTFIGSFWEKVDVNWAYLLANLVRQLVKTT